MSQLRRLLPSLNTLVAFEAVMRRGTFAGAAKELGVTGPAVSRTIGRLEFHLGLPLFDRTPAGAVPTRDGDELFSGISRGFGEIEGTVVKLKARREPRRRPILLSVSSAFATHWFMPRLSKFRACFPGEEVQFHLISGPLGGQPAGDADIAMRFDHKVDPVGRVETLMPELVLPVGSPGCHAVAATTDVRPAPEPRLISLDRSRPDWASVFPNADLQPDAELRFSDYSLVVQAALVGQGVALGWLNVVSRLLVEGELVPAGPALIATGRQCDLIVQNSKHADRLVDVCAWIRGEIMDDFSLLREMYPDVFATA